MRGMHALVNVMKKNKTITQIDLDDNPRIRIVSVVINLIRQSLQVLQLCIFLLRTC